MKSTEQIAKRVIESINKDPRELQEFIDFSKIYVIALKIAFRCDRQSAWELLGIYIRELEKIALWRRKYNRRIDEVARGKKGHLGVETLNNRLKDILNEARKLKEEFEADYRNMIKNKKESFD